MNKGAKNLDKVFLDGKVVSVLHQESLGVLDLVDLECQMALPQNLILKQFVAMTLRIGDLYRSYTLGDMILTSAIMLM